MTTSDIQGRRIAINGITEKLLFPGIDYPLLSYNRNAAALRSDGINKYEKTPKNNVPKERIHIGASMEGDASFVRDSQAPSLGGWKNM